jgi:myosin-crossreactive antigen
MQYLDMECDAYMSNVMLRWNMMLIDEMWCSDMEFCAYKRNVMHRQHGI